MLSFTVFCNAQEIDSLHNQKPKKEKISKHNAKPNDAENDTKVKSDTVKKWTFNKLLQTNNFDIKFVKANEYYNNGKYEKALELYDQLVPHERGLSRGAEVTFKQAMCNHKTGDHMYAGYLFKIFYQTYPTSNFAEEALYMSAYCYYLDIPRWSLDQTTTLDAISQFQLFMSKYPKSKLIDTSNVFVNKMQNVLEKKSFENAKLYYDTEYYKAARVSLNNALEEYPDSHYKEEILYYLCKSSYSYALQSLRERQPERFKDAISDCLTYKNYFPAGKYYKEIDRIQQISADKVKSLSK